MPATAVRILCLLIIVLSFTNARTHAQTPAAEPPLEITADNTLEWDRGRQIFTAAGNAQARQDDMTVNADKLEARYKSSGEKNIDIRELTATGNVVLKSRENTAYGDKATYNLDSELAVLTGQNLRMTAPNQTVTANERFEYWVSQGKVHAIGNPVITQINEKGETNTLKADKFTATIRENGQGKRVFHTLEAQGNVIITTPAETLTGTYGIYNADTNTAEVTGGVRLTRGPNILTGEKAQVDLNTNVSRILGSGTPSGRVRGVFYPGSEKKE